MNLNTLVLSKGSATQIGSVTAEVDGVLCLPSINSLNGSEPPAGSMQYAAIVRNNSDGTCSLLGFGSAVWGASSWQITCSATLCATTVTITVLR